MDSIFFYIVAATAVISGILVVGCKNPINSALSLIMTFFSLATLYVMLDAPFMAAIQVIVYAGAIMVLIVFVIMLLNIRIESGKRYMHTRVMGAILGAVVLIETLYVIMRPASQNLTGGNGPIDAATVLNVGHTELIGRALFTDYLLPFEITSILLLVAIVGAVLLAKRKV